MRAQRPGGFELGQLTDAFNNLLAQVEGAQTRLQSQLNRLDLLHRITRAIGERQDLPSIFQVLLRNLEDELRIDFGCICLYDVADADVLSVATIGANSRKHAQALAVDEQFRIPVDQNGLARCVTGELVYEPDVTDISFPFPQRFARAGILSLVLAPLLVQTRVFGVLVVSRRAPQAFGSAECEFLRHLSEHVALAAHQTQLHGDLQHAYDDLRLSQHATMQQERLRALGQMASGIAHDINNAISPIALYTESLLEREPGLSDRARGYLITIQRAIDDVAETVARMREFYRAREPDLSLTRVGLNRLVDQVVELTRARWSDVPLRSGIVITLQTDLARRPAGHHGLGDGNQGRSDQPRIQCRRCDARGRRADAAYPKRAVNGAAGGRRHGPQSMLRFPIPASAWMRRPGAAASSLSIRPRENEAPGWDSPWSTA